MEMLLELTYFCFERTAGQMLGDWGRYQSAKGIHTT